MVLQLIGWRRGNGYDLALKLDSGVDVPTLNFGGTPIQLVIVGLWSTSSEGTATSPRCGTHGGCHGRIMFELWRMWLSDV